MTRIARPFYIPVGVQKGRLVYRTASCLEEYSSFLQMTQNKDHNRQSPPVSNGLGP